MPDSTQSPIQFIDTILPWKLTNIKTLKSILTDGFSKVKYFHKFAAVLKLSSVAQSREIRNFQFLNFLRILETLRKLKIF